MIGIATFKTALRRGAVLKTIFTQHKGGPIDWTTLFTKLPIDGCSTSINGKMEFIFKTASLRSAVLKTVL